ncbi:sigma factor [Streptomyces sp. NBC_01450]|uniref:sigma factor n=1 Tax=Streptomyces sp. NBC_01450 TaxID=2903871 RepID=UPI003FCECB94
MAILRSRASKATSDEVLIRALYAEHGKALLAYATRLTGDRAAAEDVVQETLIRAWKHPEVTDGPRVSRRGRLLMVARSVATDGSRSTTRDTLGGEGQLSGTDACQRSKNSPRSA